VGIEHIGELVAAAGWAKQQRQRLIGDRHAFMNLKVKLNCFLDQPERAGTLAT
jgi:hypothetical protein